MGHLRLMKILAIIDLRTTPDSAWIVELGAVLLNIGILNAIQLLKKTIERRLNKISLVEKQALSRKRT